MNHYWINIQLLDSLQSAAMLVFQQFSYLFTGIYTTTGLVTSK